MQPQATFLVWCDFRAYGDWKTVSARLIKEARVALSGGTFFGPAGEGGFVSTAVIHGNSSFRQWSVSAAT